MKLLSSKNHWDEVHEAEAAAFAQEPSADGRNGETTKKRWVIKTVKKVLGSGVLRRMSSYEDYLLWEVLFRKYLPDLKNSKVLEIGSAPGEFLVQLALRYGCIPYGVDYSL